MVASLSSPEERIQPLSQDRAPRHDLRRKTTKQFIRKVQLKIPEEPVAFNLIPPLRGTALQQILVTAGLIDDSRPHLRQ